MAFRMGNRMGVIVPYSWCSAVFTASLCGAGWAAVVVAFGVVGRRGGGGEREKGG